MIEVSIEKNLNTGEWKDIKKTDSLRVKVGKNIFDLTVNEGKLRVQSLEQMVIIPNVSNSITLELRR